MYELTILNTKSQHIDIHTHAHVYSTIITSPSVMSTPYAAMSSTEARFARGAFRLPELLRLSTLVACMDEALRGRGGCMSVSSGS